MKSFIVSMGLLLASCSGESFEDADGSGVEGNGGAGGGSGGGNGNCAAPAGQYQLIQQKETGNCGEYNPVVEPLSSQVLLGCAYQGAARDTACVMQYWQRCDHPVEQYVSEISGTLQWTQDAASASGRVDLLNIARDSSVLCESRYAISLTRL